jgi:hypothetical protein
MPGEGREMPKTVKVQYVLEDRHVDALRAAAAKRAMERRSGRLDASEILREILDAWMAKGGKR